MILITKIKLDSPILGVHRHKMEKGGTIKRLARDNDGKVVTRREHWQWAIKEAMDTLKLPTEVSRLAIPELLPFEAPSTGLHNRHYKKDGVMKTEAYESIRQGAELTVGVLVASSPHPYLHPSSATMPTQEQFENTLRYIGSFIGISQWGNTHGYGRFNLLTVSEATPEQVERILRKK